MKHSLQLVKNAGLSAGLLLLSAIAFAQDSVASASSSSTTTSTTTTEQKMWYMQPWAWVVGGIILLLIILMAARGGNKDSRTDRVTVTKTVRTDSDTV